MAFDINQTTIVSEQTDRAAAMGYHPKNGDFYRFFAEEVFPKIDGKPFETLFNPDNMGAHPIPVNIKIGALVLAELEHMPLKQFAMHLLTDVSYQYALHCTSTNCPIPSFDTLQEFRKRVMDHFKVGNGDLMHTVFRDVTDAMLEAAGYVLGKLRMDATMVNTYTKKLGRYELIYVGTADFVATLNKEQVELDERLMHFLEKGDRNRAIYHDRDTSKETKMEILLQDATLAVTKYGPGHEECPQFQLLQRILYEQTTTDEDGKVHLRPKGDPVLRGMPPKATGTENVSKSPENQEEPGDNPTAGGPGQAAKSSGSDAAATRKHPILQTPVDPEATGKTKDNDYYVGYTALASEFETKYGPVLMDYRIRQNIVADNVLAAEMAQEMRRREEGGICCADGAFVGDKLTQAMADKNYTIAHTNLSGKATPACLGLTEFGDDNQTVVKCPGGFAPIKTAIDKNGACRCNFAKSACATCPYRESCHPKEQKNSCVRTFTPKQKLRALFQAQRGTEEFSEFCHFRNGIEAVFSLLKRSYGVGKLEAYGLAAITVRLGIIFLAVNIRKFFLRMTAKAAEAEAA